MIERCTNFDGPVVSVTNGVGCWNDVEAAIHGSDEPLFGVGIEVSKRDLNWLKYVEKGTKSLFGIELPLSISTLLKVKPYHHE